VIKFKKNTGARRLNTEPKEFGLFVEEDH
jgi:hypothetical protein